MPVHAAPHESASGPKQTSLTALHMSAFGGKADMTVCGSPLSRSLLDLERTCRLAPHMSAHDPKRTFHHPRPGADITTREKLPSRRGISARLVHLPEAHDCGFQARRISRPECRLRACGLHQMVSTHHYGCEGPASAPKLAGACR